MAANDDADGRTPRKDRREMHGFSKPKLSLRIFAAVRVIDVRDCGYYLTAPKA